MDNIPGVPGVGLKTATQLLKWFGSIDGIYARLAEIKSENQRTALHNAAEAVRRNQRMVQLKCELPDGPTLESLVPRAPDPVALRPMYQRWNFRSLLAEVGGPLEPSEARSTAPSQPPQQGQLF